MQLAKLKKMLKKIDQHQPIKLYDFIQHIEKIKFHDYCFEAQDIQGLPAKNGMYYIEHIHPQLLKLLHQFIDNAGHDRISAAVQNFSHRHKVDGSFLLIRKINKHPQVIIFKKDQSFEPPMHLADDLIVVENRQLFLDADDFFIFLNQFCALELEPHGVDLIFGMGNEINNSLHHKFLERYKTIYLCLDLDLGGLISANTLMLSLPDTHIIYVQPSDIEQRLRRVMRAREYNYLQKIGELQLNAHPQLHPYIQLIRKTGRTLEQESFLYHDQSV